MDQSARTFPGAGRPGALGGAGLCVLLGAICLIALPVPRRPAAAQEPQPSFRQLMSQGRKLRSAGNLRAASAKYNAAVKASAGDEERAQALIEHAHVLRALGREERAEEKLKQAVGLDAPDEVRRAAMMQLAILLDQQGRLDEAVELYQRLAEAVAEHPEQVAEALLSSAQLLCDAERYREARRILEKLTPDRLLPHHRIQAANLLAEALIALGDLDAATSAIAGADVTDSAVAHLNIRLARALLAAGREEAAAKACRAALAADPDNRVVWRTRYEIAAQRGTLEELRAELAEQLDNDPGNMALIEQAASLAEWDDDPDRALDVYRKLVRLRPDDSAVLERAGSLAANAGRTDEALDLLQAALRLQPDDVGLHYMIGEVYAKTGNTSAAVEAWKKGTAFDAGDSRAAQRLGDLLAQHGLYEEATQIYRDCRQRTGDQTVLAAEMAQALTALLRPEDALSEYVAAASAGLDDAELVAPEATKLAEESGLTEELVGRARTGLKATGAPGLALLLAMVEAGQGRIGEAVKEAAEAGLAPGELITIAESLELEGHREASARLYAVVATNAATPAGLRLEIGLRAAEIDAAAGRTAEAATILRQVTSGSAGPPQLQDRALLLLADIDLTSGGDIRQARQTFEALAAQSPLPDVAEKARWRLADCAFAEGDFEHAAALYQGLAERASVETIPLPPPPPFALPGSHRLPVPHMILEIQPDDPRMTPAYAFSQIAECAFRSGDLDRAKALFAEVAEKYPQSIYANDAVERRAFVGTHFAQPRPAADRYLAALAGGAGERWEAAIGDLREITAQGEAECLADDAAMLIGALLEAHGQRAEAAAQFRAIPSAHPGSLLAPEALLHAARLTRSLGDGEQARKDLEAVLQNFPHAPMAKTASLWLDNLQHGRPWTADPAAP